MDDSIGDAGSWRIAPLSAEDALEAAQLLHDTVHAVNARDYSAEQLDAWAPDDDEYSASVAERLRSQVAIGAKEHGRLIGFGSLDASGDFDMLFVRADRQRRGVAQGIAREIERLAAARGQASIGAFVSITALPFFKQRGYAVAFENTVMRNGVALANYRMEKRLANN